MKTTEFDCFIFTHIPKCGGTSFREYLNKTALQAGYSKMEIYIPGSNGIPNEKNVSELEKSELSRLKKIPVKIWAGHHQYGQLNELGLHTGSNPFRYTILREPIRRFISHYNFFNYKLGNQGCKDKKLADLSIDQLEDVIIRLANLQTKYLSNIKLIKAFNPKNVLKVAKYNLAYEYNCFGLLENMEESTNLLKIKFPDLFENAEEFPKKNEYVLEDKPDQKIVNRIKKHNKLDIELYAFAKENFKFQCSKNLK